MVVFWRVASFTHVGVHVLVRHEHRQVLKQGRLALNFVFGHRVALSLPVGRDGFFVDHNFLLHRCELEVAVALIDHRLSWLATYDCISRRVARVECVSEDEALGPLLVGHHHRLFVLKLGKDLALRLFQSLVDG